LHEIGSGMFKRGAQTSGVWILFEMGLVIWNREFRPTHWRSRDVFWNAAIKTWGGHRHIDLVEANLRLRYC